MRFHEVVPESELHKYVFNFRENNPNKLDSSDLYVSFHYSKVNRYELVFEFDKAPKNNNPRCKSFCGGGQWNGYYCNYSWDLSTCIVTSGR